MSDLPLSPVAAVVDAVKGGRMVILVDERGGRAGVLACAAAAADAAKINFMALHARGLVCLALTETQASALALSPMTGRSNGRARNAMMASIEAREGVSTGISAADRARTIAAAIDPASGPSDIVSPGHVFPILAKDEGLLAALNFAEAGMDIARLAGLPPSAVLCDILDEDGGMAQAGDLIALADAHGLVIGSLQDLARHVYLNGPPLPLARETEFVSRFGGLWTCRTYQDAVGGPDHVVLIHGDDNGHGTVPVYVHRLSLMADVLGEAGPRADRLHMAMTQIADTGSGVIILLGSGGDASVGPQVMQPDDADVAARILKTLAPPRVVQLHAAGETPIDLSAAGVATAGHAEIRSPANSGAALRMPPRVRQDVAA